VIAVGKIEVECEYCGDDFMVKQSEKERRTFCSKECQGKWMSENNKGKNHPSWEGGLVTLDCDYCGKEYKAHPYRESRFCSPECYHNWRRESDVNSGENNYSWKERTRKKCEYCGDVFEVIPSEKDKKFCSMECYAKWQSENKTGKKSPSWKGKVGVECEECGEEFQVHPYREEKSNFCSKECQGEWMSENNMGENNPTWKGGNDGYRGNSWPEERKRALKRDGYKCVICGKDKEELGTSLHVHHIVPYRLTKNNSPSNLISLCRKHHNKAEKILNEYEKENYIKIGYFAELNDFLTGDSSD